MSDLNTKERECLQELIAVVQPRLNCLGRDIFYFEHGSVPGSPASCGVDQAHLHVAPRPFDLIEAATQRRDVAWKATSCRPYSLSIRQHEYLFVSDSYGRSMIGTAKAPSSQWFRRLIAAETDQNELWDYRTYFGLKELAETAQLVGQIA